VFDKLMPRLEDIVGFVRLRCAKNGLVYPGGIGRTEDRIAQACIHEALCRGWELYGGR
jgi:hypothetical protein